MRRTLRRSDEQEMDISPLIDVVFILLIFFMVTTTFVRDRDLDIERPAASSATVSSSKAIRVQIEADASVYVEGVPVRPWMLQSRIRDLIRDSSEKSVLVVPDRRVTAEKLIEVVDQARLAGARDVGVATIELGG